MLENVIYTNTYMYFKTVISQKILEGLYTLNYKDLEINLKDCD